MKKQPWHINGKLHVKGASIFIGEDIKPAGLLYARFLFSPVAHAEIKKLDTLAAKALPDVAAVLTWADIPGENQIGHVIKDEPLFPPKKIMYVGQPLAMALSPYPKVAEQAVKMIELEYEELKPVFSIDEADRMKEWYVPERKFENGDVTAALKKADYTISGEIESSNQEHFYMETQRCWAVPGEDNTLTLYSATQSTMEVQEVMSHVLNIPAHSIIIDVKRLGGAFGGKERGGTLWACLAGLGAYVTQKPVEVLLDRIEDMQATGKRHPFKSKFKVGFDRKGKISAYDVELLSNGGAYADLSVAILARAMFHAENAYHIPNIRIRGRACRTNLPPNTAFRGFGAPESIYVIERVMDEIAHKLQLDPLEVKLLNIYNKRNSTPYGQVIKEIGLRSLFGRLKEVSDYKNLKKEVAEFNLNNSHKKQGIGIVPVKFGISFTTALLNQGSALVWIYIDGTVSVTTGGIEMGQEANSKIALVVAKALGISYERIRMESSNSQRVGNASPTAASTCSDINGNAARIAAGKIKDRLLPLAAKLLADRAAIKVTAKSIIMSCDKVFIRRKPELSITFTELIKAAYNNRLPLGAYGFYATPRIHFDRDTEKGHPFAYYVYGCALAQAEIETLTGDSKLKQVFIVHETASSLHPDIDRGQIIGAFVQAMGWCTMEDLPHDEKGRYLALSPSTYKIPGIRDLPEKLVVEMVQTHCKQASVLGSKAVGEPPFIYGEAVWFAIRDAVNSAGGGTQLASLAFPATPEAILLAIESLKNQKQNIKDC